ncbi:MAG: hypothetical protein R6W70_04020 [bacterium]
MKKMFFIIMTMAFVLVSCASQEPVQKKKTLLDRKVEAVEQNNQGDKVKQLVKIFEFKEKYGDKVLPHIKSKISQIKAAVPKHELPEFKESPNKEIEIPADKIQIDIKNNYPSGEMFVTVEKGGDFVDYGFFEFNTEKKLELEPGKYSFNIFINRKFNDNTYFFSTEINSSGGELLLGEFTVKSEYNKSGKCPDGQIQDGDVCMDVIFDVLDNCPPGNHLVDRQLCCPEGYNFIMDGSCSRYSDKVETPVCPEGTYPAGRGRCCPEGTELIEGRCREAEDSEDSEDSSE